MNVWVFPAAASVQQCSSCISLSTKPVNPCRTRLRMRSTCHKPETASTHFRSEVWPRFTAWNATLPVIPANAPLSHSRIRPLSGRGMRRCGFSASSWCINLEGFGYTFFWLGTSCGNQLWGGFHGDWAPPSVTGCLFGVFSLPSGSGCNWTPFLTEPQSFSVSAVEEKAGTAG